jgi:hypothetical protein
LGKGLDVEEFHGSAGSAHQQNKIERPTRYFLGYQSLLEYREVLHIGLGDY